MRTISTFLIENLSGESRDSSVYGITDDGEKIIIGFIKDYTIFQEARKILPILTMSTYNFKVDLKLSQSADLLNEDKKNINEEKNN
jgi:hypothetical protein